MEGADRGATGKLIEAAERLVNYQPASRIQDYQEDINRFGLVLEIDEPPKDDVLEIWPANWNALQWFLICQTQWRVAADGQRIGLDYLAAEASSRLAGMSISPEDFRRFRALERAVMERL